MDIDESAMNIAESSMDIEDESIDQLLERAQLVLNENELIINNHRSATETIATESSLPSLSTINDGIVQSFVLSILNEAQAVLDSVTVGNAAPFINGIIFQKTLQS